MINRAASKVAADGNANHHRAGESIVGAPAYYAELVANLHHRGPNVIEELNLDNGLQSAGGHAGGASHNGGLGEWRIEYAVVAELALQAEGELEDSAFAFHELAL